MTVTEADDTIYTKGEPLPCRRAKRSTRHNPGWSVVWLAAIASWHTSWTSRCPSGSALRRQGHLPLGPRS